jgi:hypothetical protein
VALLNAPLRDQLHTVFAGLPHRVTLRLFVTPACTTCEEARELVEELASASDGKIGIEVYDLAAHPPEATLYRIDKAPASAGCREP